MFFFHLPTERHLDVSVLAFMNKAAVNIQVQLFMGAYIFNSFPQLPRHVMAGSNGKSIFNFVRNC